MRFGENGAFVEHSRAFVHAEQQLQAQGDACVPAQGQDTDETGHNGGSQQVLDRRGAVRVPIKHLRKDMQVGKSYTYNANNTSFILSQWLIQLYSLPPLTLLLPVWSL